MVQSTLSSSDTAERLRGTAFVHLSPALHASYSTDDFATASAFVARVAEAADAMNHHPEVRLGYGSVAFELSSHDAGGVTERDVELATRIQSIADELGARADSVPTARYTIAIDTLDADHIRDFWRVGMGYVESVTGDEVELVDPRGIAPKIWFQEMEPPRLDRNRIHLDVYVPTTDARARVDAVLAAGGTLMTDEYAPEWWVLADVEGNELCICTAD
ncbi:4a-hydroxytetrahydrobiopterin dehydratase [Parafrigoribacterium soli]|uniref:4a-hydroxytetrahydrobiopterin dehydratase n=1 Tax=Parafrigoribacterium soli TaxID=3144663 RepID=UPI0032EB7043